MMTHHDSAGRQSWKEQGCMPQFRDKGGAEGDVMQWKCLKAEWEGG